MVNPFDVVARATYKPGYSFELLPFDSETYKLQLLTPVKPFENPHSEASFTVSKILPKSAIDVMPEETLQKVLIGLVLWWETHEAAEWFRIDGRQVLDVSEDHVGTPASWGRDTHLSQLLWMADFADRRFNSRRPTITLNIGSFR